MERSRAISSGVCDPRQGLFRDWQGAGADHRPSCRPNPPHAGEARQVRKRHPDQGRLHLADTERAMDAYGIAVMIASDDALDFLATVW